MIPKKAKFKPIDVITDTIKRRRNRNILCGEFGIRTQEDLDDFIEVRLKQDMEVRGAHDARGAYATCTPIPLVRRRRLPAPQRLFREMMYPIIVCYMPVGRYQSTRAESLSLGPAIHYG